jgi:branched-chain amino acid aminotransferase
MQSTNYAYVNGKFVRNSEARVSIFDPGFLYGDGCFETLRIYEGRMFRAAEHMERLSTGLKALGIEAWLSPEEMRAVCRALIQTNHVTSGVARVYQTRQSIVVTANPRVCEPEKLRAIVSRVALNPQFSCLKTANRLPYIMAQWEANCAKVNEAVMLNTAGKVVEFTRSNIFVVHRGGLWTPPLSDGPLPGITRRAVIALAQESKIAVREESFTAKLLDEAEEVFATNSLIEVSPVLTWSRQQIITKQLQTAYAELVKCELSTLRP